MEIQHQDDGHKGIFYIEKDGEILAELTYVWAGEHKFIIDHTEVNEALEGQGIGKLLLQKTVEFARSKNLKIIPLCPFAKAVMSKHAADYQDVLA